MIVKAETISGETIILPDAISLEINMEKDVPADDCKIILPYVETEGFVKISIEENDVVFYGIVDVMTITATSKGRFLTIEARSLAALLLNNEAKPQTYTYPSLSVIYDNHIKEYGIKLAAVEDIEDTVLMGSYEVLKGASQWQALAGFCQSCFGKNPIVNSTGTLLVNAENKKEITFSDIGEGVNYSKISYKKHNHKKIGKVFVKTSYDDDYSMKIENKSLDKNELFAVRYVNAITKNTPIITADKIIEKSNLDTVLVYLECNGCCCSFFNAKATLNDSMLGETQNLVVSKIKYIKTANKDYTQITLTKEG